MKGDYVWGGRWPGIGISAHRCAVRLVDVLGIYEFQFHTYESAYRLCAYYHLLWCTVLWAPPRDAVYYVSYRSSRVSIYIYIYMCVYVGRRATYGKEIDRTCFKEDTRSFDHCAINARPLIISVRNVSHPVYMLSSHSFPFFVVLTLL